MLYEFRHSNGQICCSANSTQYLCDACKALAAQGPESVRRTIRDSTKAPDPAHDPMYAYRKAIPSLSPSGTPPAPSRATIDPARERARLDYLRTPAPNGYQIALDKQKDRASD